MKCLVTGVAGFIGSWLAERLLECGFSVVGIDAFVDYYDQRIKRDNLKDLVSNRNFELIEQDINEAPLRDILNGIEVVFHQAGQAGVRSSWGRDFDSYLENNIRATHRLLEQCVGLASLKRFVYASSSSVYGNALTYPTKEDVVPQPVSPYGVTKLAAERLVTVYASEMGVPAISLRYFTVYGPRQRPDMFFFRLCRSALTGEPVTVFGDGTQSREFTYVDDVVRANILAIERGNIGGVYNIGGGSNVTVNEVIKLVSSKVKPVNVIYKERVKGDAYKTCADISLARSDLGYNPTISLEEGIMKQAEWIENRLGNLF